MSGVTRWVDDEDWRVLPRALKALYQQIIEQPSITKAGVIQTGVDVLAEQHIDVEEADLDADLDALAAAGWIVRDGSVIWVTSWFDTQRNLRNPKYLKAAVDAVKAIPKQAVREQAAQALRNAAVHGDDAGILAGLPKPR